MLALFVIILGTVAFGQETTLAVIPSKQEPPLPLPRLRVRGEVAEFRADDLRFTTEEAADFLNKSMGLTLDAELITALEKPAAGWVAGMQMAALSMQCSSLGGMTEFIEAFSSR